MQNDSGMIEKGKFQLSARGKRQNLFEESMGEDKKEDSEEKFHFNEAHGWGAFKGESWEFKL